MDSHSCRHSKGGRGRPSKSDMATLISRSNIIDVFSLSLWNMIEPHEQQRLMRYLPECDLLMETTTPSKLEESVEVEMEEENRKDGVEETELGGKEVEGKEKEQEEEQEGEEEEDVEVENLDCDKESEYVSVILTSPPTEEEEINIVETQEETGGGHAFIHNDPLGLWSAVANLEAMDTSRETEILEECMTKENMGENGVHPMLFLDPTEKEDEKMERDDDFKEEIEKEPMPQIVPHETDGVVPLPPIPSDNHSTTSISEPSMVDIIFSSLTTLNSPFIPESPKASIRPHIFSTPSFRQSLLIYQDYLITGRLSKVLDSCCYESNLSVAELPFMRQRMEGEEGLDDEEWKDANFESYWGQLSEQKKQYRNSQVAGESAQIKLRDLIAKGMLKAKDILVYEKSFEVLQQVVRGEYQILHVSAKCDTLYARHLSSDEEYTFAGLNHLETVTFREAAGSEGIRKPNGNAWKCTIRKRPGHPAVSFFHLRKEYMALYLSEGN